MKRLKTLSNNLKSSTGFILFLAIGIGIGLQSKHLVQHYAWQLFTDSQTSAYSSEFETLDSSYFASAFTANDGGCGCPSCCSVENI